MATASVVDAEIGVPSIHNSELAIKGSHFKFKAVSNSECVCMLDSQQEILIR